MTTPIEALNRFTEAFGDPFIADDIATHMSCVEVEILADVFRAVGQSDVADMWIEAHAEGDDEGDDHYREEED